MIVRLLKSFSTYVAAPVAMSSEEIDAQVTEEIEFHLAERTREGVERGLSEAEARRVARERFGDPASIRKVCVQTTRGDLLVCHHVHLLVTVGLFVALLAVLWTDDREQPAGLTIDSPAMNQLTEMIARKVVSEGRRTTGASGDPAAGKPAGMTGDVAGQVLDDQGQPIGDAKVLIVVKTWPDGWYRQVPYAAITGDDGRFRVEDVYDPQEQHAAQIAVVADHRVLESSYDLQPRGELQPVVFRLRSSSGLMLRVEEQSGNVIRGAEVMPHHRIDAAGQEHGVYFCSGGPATLRSDHDGRVAMPYFNPGDTATFYVRGPHSEWEPREIVVPESGNVVTLQLGTSGRKRS